MERRNDALLVMATRASLAGPLLGNVIEEVLEAIDQPVLLVGPHVRRLGGRAPKPTLVVCIDHTDAAVTAVPAIARWVATFGATETWVTEVIPTGTAGSSSGDSSSEHVRHLARLLADLGVESSWGVLCGDEPDVRLEEFGTRLAIPSSSPPACAGRTDGCTGTAPHTNWSSARRARSSSYQRIEHPERRDLPTCGYPLVRVAAGRAAGSPEGNLQVSLERRIAETRYPQPPRSGDPRTPRQARDHRRRTPDQHPWTPAGAQRRGRRDPPARRDQRGRRRTQPACPPPSRAMCDGDAAIGSYLEADRTAGTHRRRVRASRRWWDRCSCSRRCLAYVDSAAARAGSTSASRPSS